MNASPAFRIVHSTNNRGPGPHQGAVLPSSLLLPVSSCGLRLPLYIPRLRLASIIHNPQRTPHLHLIYFSDHIPISPKRPKRQRSRLKPGGTWPPLAGIFFYRHPPRLWAEGFGRLSGASKIQTCLCLHFRSPFAQHVYYFSFFVSELGTFEIASRIGFIITLVT